MKDYIRNKCLPQNLRTCGENWSLNIVESVFSVYFYNKDILLHTVYTEKFLTVKRQYYLYLCTP